MMRALVWFAGCIGLYFLADQMHLWRAMLQYTAILFIWAWVFVGAFWVSSGRSAGRRMRPTSGADVAGLRAAAEQAARQGARDRGEPLP
jgi:threonine/homoserine/homoserine lactone efflux protein